jgi:hypothetical protein
MVKKREEQEAARAAEAEEEAEEAAPEPVDNNAELPPAATAAQPYVLARQALFAARVHVLRSCNRYLPFHSFVLVRGPVSRVLCRFCVYSHF